MGLQAGLSLWNSDLALTEERDLLLSLIMTLVSAALCLAREYLELAVE